MIRSNLLSAIYISRLCAGTCWRGENDAVSDGETGTAKQQHTTDNQPDGPGSVEDLGHYFEMKIIAVIGLRGLHRGGNFDLYSNMDDVGNFDDIVCTAGGRWYFLQLKLAERPTKKKVHPLSTSLFAITFAFTFNMARLTVT